MVVIFCKGVMNEIERNVHQQNVLFRCFKIHRTDWHTMQELENLSDKISDIRED